jgi:hypothetical protein
LKGSKFLLIYIHYSKQSWYVYTVEAIFAHIICFIISRKSVGKSCVVSKHDE